MKQLGKYSDLLNSVKETQPRPALPSSGELHFLQEMAEVKALPDLLEKKLGGVRHGTGRQTARM